MKYDADANHQKVAEGAMGIAFLIPQVFYDVIARFAPGAVILSALILMTVGLEQTRAELGTLKELISSSFVLGLLVFLVFLAYMYTVAIILKGLLALFTEALPAARKKQLWPKVDNLPEKFDYIRLHNYEAGNRISKLNAEVHMTEVLCLGFLVGSILGAGISLTDAGSSRWMLVSLFLGFAFASFGMRCHLLVRRNTAVNNYAALLHYP